MGGCTTCLRDRELFLNSYFSASGTLTWESQQSFPPSEESPRACRLALVSRQGVGFSFKTPLQLMEASDLFWSQKPCGLGPAWWTEAPWSSTRFLESGYISPGNGLENCTVHSTQSFSRMKPSLFLNRKLWWNKSKDVCGAANETSACINRSINWFVFADQKKKLIASTPYSTSVVKVE